MKSINMENLWFVVDSTWKSDGYMFDFPERVYLSYVDACYDCSENMMVVCFNEIWNKIHNDIHDDA